MLITKPIRFCEYTFQTSHPSIINKQKEISWELKQISCVEDVANLAMSLENRTTWGNIWSTGGIGWTEEAGISQYGQ